MKHILFIVAIVCGIFTQQDVLAQQKKIRSPYNMQFPSKDTVILKGSKVKIGSYLEKGWVEEVEIENFGKSKKRDLERGIFFIEVSPKRTTAYQMRMIAYSDRKKIAKKRTIYVVESEEEKKEVEKKMLKNTGSSLSIGNVSLRVMGDEAKKKDTTSTSNPEIKNTQTDKK